MVLRLMRIPMISIYNLSAGVNYVNYGDFEGYDETDSLQQVFYKRNSALFWVLLLCSYTDLHIGASGKFISSTLNIQFAWWSSGHWSDLY
jgi:hypothetical protein